ncbi:thioredoxin family protein [Actimicrobium sp. CCI2.3]|uniref:thioredoxin family protein n=1 Tax=Actimicrobium sp. CCI2.3 TaxID=3048616 RepID=UPI002AB4E98C|nr:thioredoxin family protein [Actimicrobium sp. CCI2.3]MDY7575224.1 thioredoxin family protein [Actimicrobium sp. CCI2.3]MEB0022313.1 thioredoxin family protein [Actimicrobium sp. CCI2.3]
MTSLILNDDTLPQLQEWLRSDDLLVACLCAAWCDVCRDYRPQFDDLAARHPDKRFLWIDIEDQADMLGDIEVENFPTLLVQRNAHVAFFGSVQPGLQLAERLVQAQAALSAEELATVAASHSGEQRFHLQRLLDDAAG